MKTGSQASFHVKQSTIAQCFSLAASDYQRHDVVQRSTAKHLLNSINASGRLLDLGCGPGTDFSALSGVSDVVAVDIAPGMLNQLGITQPEQIPLCADAQALPLKNDSVALVYSNLALQWCEDLQSAVAEIERVLQPNGECHLAIVGHGSLDELKQLGLRVNDFNHLDRINACFDAQQWQQLTIVCQEFTVYFDELKPLLYSIKGVGASVRATTDNASQQARLRGRQDWQQLTSRAEAIRQPQGLPLTYQIMIVRGKLVGEPCAIL